MKSIMIRNAYDAVIIDEEAPKAGPGEIVVEAAVSGISSGTEMMLYRGTYPNFKLKKWPAWQEYPVQPGYELVGKVVEVGPSSSGSGGVGSMQSLQPGASVIVGDTSEFHVGDRVVCMGSHQQYAKVPATLAAKIPDHVSDAQATLAILGTTTMHSTRRLALEYGSTVAVIGMGVVGNLALQQAKLAGAATTIGLDLDRGRLELARKAGADHVIEVGREDPVKVVLSHTKGMGADAVVEASGAGNSVQLAIDLMRDGGVIELLAWRNEASFIFGDLYFKEGKLIATRAIGPDAGLPYAFVRWGCDQSLRLAMRMVGDGRLKTDFYKPAEFSYQEIRKVYELIDKDQARIGLQAVLVWR
jgi:2-desacetyl-2-hydroxyethyl bacteriochlorophyllide A dehydrogenase